MATMSDYEKFEKTVVFGGITHSKIETHGYKKTPDKNKDPKSATCDSNEEGDNIPESSHLSNDLYCLEIRQIM